MYSVFHLIIHSFIHPLFIQQIITISAQSEVKITIPHSMELSPAVVKYTSKIITK